MTTHGTGTLEIKSWDEKTWDGKNWKDVTGAKLTHAVVIHTLHGAIEGEGTVHFLMSYSEDGSANYVGMHRVVGSLDGRSGSFVLKVDGSFKGDTAESTWSVVPDSGTGDLRGLRGEGGSVAKHGDSQPPYTLDYEFSS
jgi:hypothetical protein